MGFLWTIIIGFIAGVIAKFIMPGDKEPSGFIMTTILGIVGAFVASYLGRALGWYNPGEGAGLIGAVVGGDHRLVRVWPHHEPANDLKGAFMSGDVGSWKPRRR
jgi:uncharacterized membrane protein YeaQ/YmgE (transglycosylase-associated protein family)